MRWQARSVVRICSQAAPVKRLACPEESILIKGYACVRGLNLNVVQVVVVVVFGSAGCKKSATNAAPLRNLVRIVQIIRPVIVNIAFD